MNQTNTVEHAKAGDGNLFHAKDGSLWLVEQGRSERVIFVIGDENHSSSTQLMEGEVGEEDLDYESAVEDFDFESDMAEMDDLEDTEMEVEEHEYEGIIYHVEPNSCDIYNIDDGSIIGTWDMGANGMENGRPKLNDELIGELIDVSANTPEMMVQQGRSEGGIEEPRGQCALSGKHFKVITNAKRYTNLGPHFVEAGMYSICIGKNARYQPALDTNGKKYLKQAMSVHVGDTLHMVDGTKTYWQGVVETEFKLATRENSFYSKPGVDAVKKDRGEPDWNSLDDLEMVASVLWTKVNLTKELLGELKEVINGGRQTIKPIDTVAIEEVLAKF